MCVCVLEWDFVAVNAGYGDSGFFFNESGLQWDKPGTFGGWLGENFLAFLSLPFPSLPFLILLTSTATAPHRTALPSTDLPSSQQFHLPSSPFYNGRKKKEANALTNKKPPQPATGSTASPSSSGQRSTSRPNTRPVARRWIYCLWRLRSEKQSLG